MTNVFREVDGLVESFHDKSDLMKKDLIEPLELYFQHYNTTNSDLLTQADDIWMKMHLERNGMLFSKENYYNQMYQLN